MKAVLDAINSMLPRPRNFGAKDPEPWMPMLTSTKSASGLKVSHVTSLTLAPVWQALSIISGDVAISTLNKYVRLENGDREIEPSQDNRVVSSEWNESTPAFEGWRRLMVHALLWQNGYAWIDRGETRTGMMRGLYNMLPDRTKPVWDEDGRLSYVTEVVNPTTHQREVVPLMRSEVLHVKGLSLDSGYGVDLVQNARDSWGLALAAEKFESKFFEKGASMGGILEVPHHWTDPAKQHFLDQWLKQHQGEDSWFRVALLRDGAKFHSTMVDPQSAEMHLVRLDQVYDVARFFNLPPSKLGIEGSVSYNSKEQSQLDYVTGSLMHWFTAITSECSCKLLTVPQKQRGSHFFEHNKTMLIEADSKTMNEVLEIQRRNAIISGNEWRRKLNLPPSDDPDADRLYNPNTRKTDAAPAASPDTADADSDGDSSTSETADNLSVAARAALSDAVQRAAKRITRQVQSKARSPSEFTSWLDSRAADHRDSFDDTVRPVLNLVCLHERRDPGTALDSLNHSFFSSLLGSVSQFVEPPHSANDLHQNVVTATDGFLETSVSCFVDEVLS